jgi:hypothetical protein
MMPEGGSSCLGRFKSASISSYNLECVFIAGSREPRRTTFGRDLGEEGESFPRPSSGTSILRERKNLAALRLGGGLIQYPQRRHTEFIHSPKGPSRGQCSIVFG